MKTVSVIACRVSSFPELKGDTVVRSVYFENINDMSLWDAVADFLFEVCKEEVSIGPTYILQNNIVLIDLIVNGNETPPKVRIGRLDEATHNSIMEQYYKRHPQSVLVPTSDEELMAVIGGCP